MTKFKFLAAAVGFVIYAVLTVANVDADRGIRIEKAKDLNHGSGKLGSYKALVIGINDYKSPEIPNLKTAVNDARTFAGILEQKYGFQVDLLLDSEATKAAIYRRLRKLATSTNPDDSVLIYFAGHGDLDRTYNDGWWIPADAKGGDPLTYLDNVQVQMAMRSMKARHVLLISDSCYSGTLFGNSRALPPVIDDKYYLNLYNEKSRWGMTSGNKTPVSDGGTAGHSVFAYQLIKEFERNDKPYISTQEIYTRIAHIIANNSEQTPLCRPIVNTGDQGGEFVFVVLPKKRSSATVPSSSQSAMDKEMMFWQSIQGSSDPAMFKAYLNAFPNGVFVPIAEGKIQGLESEQPVTSIPPQVTKSRLFVDVEPKGARIRILNIKPFFQQGIELDPGIYHVEASKDGYKTEQTWVKLNAAEDKHFDIQLEQLPASIETKPSASPSVPSSATIVGLDGVYVAYANGVVRDTSTGLEWKAEPDKYMTWDEAKSWVQSLGDDWRMPTMDEIERLYKKGKGERNMTPLFKTRGWYVWSGETEGSSDARIFSFNTGGRVSRNRGDALAARAFAVRSRSDG